MGNLFTIPVYMKPLSTLLTKLKAAFLTNLYLELDKCLLLPLVLKDFF